MKQFSRANYAGTYLNRMFAYFVLVALNLAGLAMPAAAACRQALAIGLDISGSVDAQEYRLQLDGLAGAILEPEVKAAFLALPNARVRLLVYEWGGLSSQIVLLPWTEIKQPQDLQDIADILRATRRQPLEPTTALGRAMVFGANTLASQTDCWRRTIDLSGDGQSNSGPRPRAVRNAAVLQGVTINALVIGADAPPFSDVAQSEIMELSGYFQAEVIKGPDAFVQVAVEFTSFQDAMAKKLLKELQTRAVGVLASENR